MSTLRPCPRPSCHRRSTDLYKLLIRDLSTGGIIRQHRFTDGRGNFLAKTKTKVTGDGTIKSAFDDSEPYELTTKIEYSPEPAPDQAGETSA